MFLLMCPWEASTSYSETPFELLNKLLNLIAKLRGGTSRYLPLLLTKVSETLPNVAQPAPVGLDPMQMSITQGYAGASDRLPTPAPGRYSSVGRFGPDGFTFDRRYSLQPQSP